MHQHPQHTHAYLVPTSQLYLEELLVAKRGGPARLQEAVDGEARRRLYGFLAGSARTDARATGEVDRGAHRAVPHRLQQPFLRCYG